MACVRLLLLLFAAVPLAAGSDPAFTEIGKACRASTNEEDDCVETVDPPANCSQNYDVVTGLNESTCKMVCGYLLQHCYGVEFYASGDGGRCEIWKVPILRSKDVDDYKCFTSDDQSSDAEDEDLSFTFDIKLGGVDAMTFSELLTNASYEPWKTDLVKQIKDGLVSFYAERDAFSVEQNHIQVMGVENSDPPLIRVTLTASMVMDVLKLYAYFRSGSDFKDGTPMGGKTAIEAAMKTAVEAATEASGFLVSSGSTLTITIENRMLQKAEMMTSPSPSPSPSPGDTSTDGAASTKCWAAAALFLGRWVAST